MNVMPHQLRPSRPLLTALCGVSTSALAAALDEMEIDGVLHGLAPLLPGLRFAGPAVTAKQTCGPRGSFAPEEFRVDRIIDTAHPGDVIVIDNGGQPVSSWGGLASYAARRKGVAGLVVDGAVCDVEEIEDYRFPVCTRHVVPISGRSRVRLEAVNEPVTICGVTVAPGDIIVADRSGTVCLPCGAAEDVLHRARLLMQEDDRAITEMDSGMSFLEALAKTRGW